MVSTELREFVKQWNTDKSEPKKKEEKKQNPVKKILTKLDKKFLNQCPIIKQRQYITIPSVTLLIESNEDTRFLCELCRRGVQLQQPRNDN